MQGIIFWRCSSSLQTEINEWLIILLWCAALWFASWEDFSSVGSWIRTPMAGRIFCTELCSTWCVFLVCLSVGSLSLGWQVGKGVPSLCRCIYCFEFVLSFMLQKGDSFFMKVWIYRMKKTACSAPSRISRYPPCIVLIKEQGINALWVKLRLFHWCLLLWGISTLIHLTQWMSLFMMGWCNPLCYSVQ